MMNKTNLKNLALVLERELNFSANQSADVAAFSTYEPLVSAIRRAKSEEIDTPEELPGMRYWMFETEIQKFSAVEEAFSRFSLALSGLA